MVDDPTGLWERLPRVVQSRVDAELQHRRLIPAVIALREGLDPSPGLYEAQDVVLDRERWLTANGLIEPEPTVTVDDLLDTARTIPAPVVAIEATWDGDTQGWFVELLAIVDRPGLRHHSFDEVTLMLIRRGGGRRPVDGTVPGPAWPQAAEAIDMGETLAAALAVPFFFASPDSPDDRAPRWWDST